MLIDLCFLIYLVINFLEVLFGLFLLLLVLVIVWGLCVGGVGIVEWLWFSGVIQCEIVMWIVVVFVYWLYGVIMLVYFMVVIVFFVKLVMIVSNSGFFGFSMVLLFIFGVQ